MASSKEKDPGNSGRNEVGNQPEGNEPEGKDPDIGTRARKTEEYVNEVEAATKEQEADILASRETALVAGQLNKVGDTVDAIHANSTFKRTAVRAVDIMDESYAMEKLRVLWNGDIIPDKLPEDVKHVWSDLVKAFKYAVVFTPELVGPFGQGLNSMVKLGLLPYKEEAIQDAGKFKRMIIKYGFTITAIFQPEIIPLLVLIKPINRILASQDKFLAEIREYRKNRPQPNVTKKGTASEDQTASDDYNEAA